MEIIVFVLTLFGGGLFGYGIGKDVEKQKHCQQAEHSHCVGKK